MAIDIRNDEPVQIFMGDKFLTVFRILSARFKKLPLTFSIISQRADGRVNTFVWPGSGMTTRATSVHFCVKPTRGCDRTSTI